MNPTVKSNLAFALLLFSGAFILLQMGLLVAHQALNEQPQWNLLQFCLSGLQEHTVGHDITKMLFNALFVYTVLRIVLRITNQIRMSRKWNRIFQAKENKKLTKQLNYKYRGWKTRLIVVDDRAFIAVTMGIFRPKIIVSSGLLSMFSEREAKAILLHEWHHCRNYDPLKLFLTTVIMDGMGYVPIIRATVNYYKTWSELLADRFAIKQMGSVYDLANVFLRLSDRGKVRIDAVGAYFADHAINYRIMQVLEPEKPIHVPFLHLRPVLTSVFIFVFISSVVLGGCS